MKKIILNVLFIGLISIIVFPLCVSAKSITKIETSEKDYKITVSGTTEAGVLAIATLVYSENNLVYMETCDASNGLYSCVLNNTFEEGNYTVKVADYNGGDYAVDSISILKNNNIIENNPQTGDSLINYFIIGGTSVLGIVGCIIFLKKKIIIN